MSLNIGSLYASLTLNTSGFNAALQSAQSSMNRFSTNAGNVFGSVTGLSVATEAAVTALSVSVIGLGSAFSYLTAEAIKQNSTLEQTLISYKYLLGTMREVNDEMDINENVTLSAMGMARELVAELREFAQLSPFQSPEVFAVGQQLLNAGVEADRLLDVLGPIADAAAVTGENMVENFKGAALAISQMYLKGKISSEEMTKQLSNRQIPAWNALSVATGKNVAELKKLAEEGKLGREYIDDLIDGLEIMRGGASAAQSFTFGGMIQTASDLVKNIGIQITESSFVLLKNVLVNVVQSLKQLNQEGSKLRQIGRIVYDIITPLTIFAGILKDAVTGISESSIGNVTGAFDNLTISLASIASTNVGGEIASSIANSLALLLNFAVGFMDIFKELGAVIIDFLNSLGGFQQIATVAGYFVAFNVIINIVSSSMLLLSQKITALSIAMVANSAAAGTSTNIFKLLFGLFTKTNTQATLYTAILGAQNVAILQNAAANNIAAKAAIEVYKKDAAARGRAILSTNALGYTKVRTAAATLAETQAIYQNIVATGMESTAKGVAAKAALAKAEADYTLAVSSMNATIQAQVRAGAISKETAALLTNTLALNANTQAQAGNLATARTLAQTLSRMGTIGATIIAILGLLTAAFAAVEFAIFGTTNKTKALFKIFIEIGKYLGNVLLIILQSVIWFVLGIAWAFQAAATSGNRFLNSIGLYSDEALAESEERFKKIDKVLSNMSGRISTTYNDMLDNFEGISDAWNGIREVTEEELLAEQTGADLLFISRLREFMEEDEKEIRELKKKRKQVAKEYGTDSKEYKSIVEQINKAREDAAKKLGADPIYKELIEGAKQGKREYLEELSSIGSADMVDAGLEEALLEQEQNLKVWKDAVEWIEKTPIAQRTENQIKYLEMYRKKLQETLDTIAYIKTLQDSAAMDDTDVDTQTEVSTGPTKAESEFAKFKEYIRHKKAMNELALKQEIDSWAKQQKLYNKNTEDQQKIAREIKEKLYQLRSQYLNEMDEQGREEITKQKELNNLTYKLQNGKVLQFKTASDREIFALQAHRNKLIAERNKMIKAGKDIAVSMEAINDATAALTEARTNRLNELLSKEYDEITQKIEDRNQTELDAIEKHYDNKIKIIEDAIQKEKDLYDKKEDADQERKLREELDFLRLSRDKEAVDRVEEINKELAEIAHNRKIKQMEDEAELQKEALNKQRDIALQAQEEINKKRLEQAETDFEATKAKYLALAEDTSQSISSISKKIDAESDNVAKAGTNFVSSLIKGIEAMKEPLAKVVDNLAQMLDVNSMLGELKNVSQTYSNLNVVAKASSPKSYYDEKMGSAIAFNAPILSVGTMVMGDKLDAQTLGTELYNTMINYSRTTGSTVFGRA